MNERNIAALEATKRCRGCDTVKPLADFRANQNGADGHRNVCRPCEAARQREINTDPDHKDWKRGYDRAYRRRDPEKVRERSRRVYQRHRHRIIAKLQESAQSRKGLARRMLREAVARGDVVKPEHCSDCGDRPPKHRLHGHHADYDKPLDVEWLCTFCHAARERIAKGETP